MELDLQLNIRDQIIMDQQRLIEAHGLETPDMQSVWAALGYNIGRPQPPRRRSGVRDLNKPGLPFCFVMSLSLSVCVVWCLMCCR
jgi:hypothetical protein